MEDTAQLQEKIRKRLDEHRRELAERQRLIDTTMKEMLDQRGRFAAEAQHVLESVVHPRLLELSRQFDNAVISDRHSGTDFHCACEFAHTPRFPATVSLDFGVLPGEKYEELTIRYDLQMLPVLMEYKRNEEASFPLSGADETIGRWVEEKVLEFVDTYLRLETHPLYQKDYIVVDLVCGMPISATTASSRIEKHGHTLYFCSEHCKEAYLKEHDS